MTCKYTTNTLKLGTIQTAFATNYVINDFTYTAFAKCLIDRRFSKTLQYSLK